MEYVIFVAIWAAVNYFVAYYVVKNNVGFNANPILYAVGSLLFGGIYPLIFLGCKFLYWRNELKKAEMVKLRKRVEDLENKHNE